jgi:5-methyltetrahydropteroyltriglutamate--homocysteine methyltransferase
MDTLIDDVGSFPLPEGVKRDDYAKAYELAREAIISGRNPYEDLFVERTFCSVVVESFRKKLAAGLDVANYPQIYSGMRQVGDAIHEAMADGSFVVPKEKAVLPEVYVLNQQAKQLSEEFGRKIRLRISMFGPIAQYLAEVGATAYPDVLEGFAQTINHFAKNSILNNKYIETTVVSIDEPSLGHSPFSGSSELVIETLEKAYDFLGPTKQIHLHFALSIHNLLAVKGLDVLSFEYGGSPHNINEVPKNILDQADKQIRVGITRTDIDTIWAELYEKGITQPTTEQLVEPLETIQKRYRVAKAKYEERMTFTGPDCGIGSWPNQDTAELLLKRTVEAVKTA